MSCIHYIIVLPKLIIYGPALVISGTMVHINCTQLEGSPSNDLYITTPQGVVIPNSQTIFNATVNDTGTYTCIINTTIITIVEEYYLFVYGKILVTVWYTANIKIVNCNRICKKVLCVKS